jgi:hypothetical protein
MAELGQHFAAQPGRKSVATSLAARCLGRKRYRLAETRSLPGRAPTLRTPRLPVAWLSHAVVAKRTCIFGRSGGGWQSLHSSEQRPVRHQPFLVAQSCLLAACCGRD